MKKIILGFAFIAFGTFAMAQTTTATNSKGDMKNKMMEQKKDRMQDMAKDLNLSPAQVTQLKAVRDKFQTGRRAQMDSGVKPDKETMKNNKKMMETEMKKILTPDQYAKWEAKKQKMKGKMKDRKAKKDAE